MLIELKNGSGRYVMPINKASMIIARVKKRALSYLVGQVLKVSRGQADPALVQKIAAGKTEPGKGGSRMKKSKCTKQDKVGYLSYY